MEQTVLKITLVSDAGFKKTITIKDPVQNLTLTDIGQAFSIFFQNNWLSDGDLGYFTSVSKADYVTTEPVPGE